MKRRMPGAILALIVVVAAIEPCTHLWLEYGMPDTVVPTGLHIPDDSFLMPSMEIFRSNFYSPYLSCQHPAGPNDPRVYSLPHYWLYGIIGYAGHLLGLSALLTLGFANGLFSFFYLWAVYRFLRQAFPAYANRAFALFTLGGGIGGLLYLALIPWHAHPAFDACFYRYARYELLEGPFLSPVLLGNRLYYMLPLALGFLSLTGFLTALKETGWKKHVLPLIGFFLTAYCNARLGPLFLLVLYLYLLSRPRPFLENLRIALAYAVPVTAAMVLVGLQFKLHPASIENIQQLLRRSMWFGSFLSAALWFLLAAAPEAFRVLRGARGPVRMLAGAAVGYWVSFALLYAGYQAYYGNWLWGGDASAAVLLSDYAVLGAVAGGCAVWLFRPKDTPPRAPAFSWVLLWFLLLGAVALAAFGQGWFLRFMPERCMVMLGVPLAVLAAKGLERWKTRSPFVSRTLLVLLLAGGLTSIAVSALCFQGPIGHAPGKGNFQWAHSDSITPDEAKVIAAIGPGVVIAPPSQPPLYTDIIVNLRKDVSTPFGQATLSLGDTNHLAMANILRMWFSPGATEFSRRALLNYYQVDYVFCPETRPVAPAVLDELRQIPWLEEIAHAGGAVLFHVVREEATP